MGANATTFVPTYVAGEVLTAADLNVTNSGIPVFADSTARDAAFGGTGEKVLAEGQYAYLESTNTTQYYDGSSWQSLTAGLSLITAQAIGTGVSSVTVSSVFSASYENYLITMEGCQWSADDQAITFVLVGSTASYYSNLLITRYDTGAVTNINRNNAASAYIGVSDVNKAQNLNMNIFNPFTTDYTNWNGGANGYLWSGAVGGSHRVNTSYSSFTIAAAGGATLTGGTIRVYGYTNS